MLVVVVIDPPTFVVLLAFLGFNLFPATSLVKKNPTPKNQQKPSPNHAYMIPLSRLPIPCLKGDSILVTILEEEFLVGLDKCKNYLHGCLLLLKTLVLYLKLLKPRKPFVIWKLIAIGSLEELVFLESKAQHKFQDALAFEESFWREKALLNWFSLGDKNTVYFHKHIIQYFSSLFAIDNNCIHNNLISMLIPKLVSSEDNDMLTILPSPEEVKVVVLSLNDMLTILMALELYSNPSVLGSSRSSVEESLLERGMLVSPSYGSDLALLSSQQAMLK
ncbi:hypothetical protein JHK86_009865 [Glycine max]|nr:hypothetical protein JHK86_009865 [Glycine max]